MVYKIQWGNIISSFMLIKLRGHEKTFKISPKFIPMLKPLPDV
jgi:hypothetical protein